MPFQTNFVIGDNFLDSWENEVAAAGNFRKIKGGNKWLVSFDALSIIAYSTIRYSIAEYIFVCDNI